MSGNKVSLSELRPGMEHLDFKVRIVSVIGERTVKTFSGTEHRILEGEVEDETGRRGFAVWNEKTVLFGDIKAGNEVELWDCFVTSFKGVLQINVGRESEVKRLIT